MTHLINDLRLHLKRKRAYRATVAELRALPLDIRLDLDIAGVEERVARKAVYGA